MIQLNWLLAKWRMKPEVLRLRKLLDWRQKCIRFKENDESERKKARGVYSNVVATKSHYEYKDAFLNNKCLRHSMNIIQSKDHRIGTYEINKIWLFCFDDNIYIQNNGYNGLTLGY